MMENGKSRKRRQLTPEEKWEIFSEVTSQEISQADAARKVRRRRVGDHPVASVGEGRGVGGVGAGARRPQRPPPWLLLRSSPGV